MHAKSFHSLQIFDVCNIEKIRFLSGVNCGEMMWGIYAMKKVWLIYYILHLTIPLISQVTLESVTVLELVFVELKTIKPLVELKIGS